MAAAAGAKKPADGLLFRDAEDAARIPDAVAQRLETIRAVESSESHRCSAALDAAWAAVERVIALNKQREADIVALDTSLTEFDKTVFWTEESLGEHFQLTPALPPDQGAPAPPDPSSLTGTSRASDAAKFAPAAERLAPIRRCFAGVLSRRVTSPKECTLLFNGIEELQKRVLPIEESLSKSRFQLPLHVPFQHVATLVSRTLVPAKTGAYLEERLQEGALGRLKELDAAYIGLEHVKDPRIIYAALEREVAERRNFHAAAVALIDEATRVEAEMKNTFSDAHGRASTGCDEALRFVAGQARKVTDSSKALVDEVVAIEERGAAAGRAELDSLARQLKEAECRQAKARKAQESHARQIRELVKSMKKDQFVHETATAEVSRLKTEMARIEAASKQFASSCATRRVLLVDAHTACEYVNGVIEQVTDEVGKALELCRQHESRMVAEESYRKLRIAQRPMYNARDWYRALGDLLRVRQHRREDIRQRMSGSWQLEFLLAQEEQSQGAVISELETSIQHVTSQWAKLTTLLVDMEVHVPVLHQYDRDPNVMRLRSAFLALEGIGKDKDMREAHRQLLAIQQAVEDSVRTAVAEDGVLPPVPPPRESRSTVTKDAATGLRRLPRPPSGGVRRGGSDASLKGDTDPKKAKTARAAPATPVSLPAIGGATPPPKPPRQPAADRT